MMQGRLGSAAFLAAGLLGCSGGGSGSAAPDGSAAADAKTAADASMGGGTDAAAGGDTGPGADAGSSVCPFPSPTSATTCSGIELVGSSVTPTCSGTAAPAGQGGQIENGRYVLQSIELYTSDCPPASVNTGEATWIVCGNDWATVFRFPGLDGGPALTQYDVTMAADASALTATIVCPPPSTPETIPYQYTATPGRFSLIYMSQYMANGLSFTYTEEDDFALQ